MVEKKKNQGEHLTSGPTINVKAATRIAAQYLNKVVGSVSNVRIEEVEMNEEKTLWFITLGFLDTDDLFLAETKYKIFTIDANNGEALSMKIRKIG
jgi:hypothetical protein